MRRLLGCTAMVVATMALSLSASEVWTDDFAAAKTQAAKEKKDMLLDFTGSDWCIWCQRLHQEVLNIDTFQSAAQKNFVLVELDFPREKQLPAPTRKQNEDLRKQFAIEGYPSIYLTDEKGRPYAKTGYAAGGPEKYLESLEKLRAQKGPRDEALNKADKATGVERAKLLDQALTLLAANGINNGYADLATEIQTLDKDNTAGLKKKYEVRAKFQALMGGLNEGPPDMAALMTKVEDLLKESGSGLSAENKQDLLFLKANILASKKDMPAAIAALNQSKAAAPESERAQMIEKILANIAKQAAGAGAQPGVK